MVPRNSSPRSPQRFWHSNVTEGRSKGGDSIYFEHAGACCDASRHRRCAPAKYASAIAGCVPYELASEGRPESTVKGASADLGAQATNPATRLVLVANPLSSQASIDLHCHRLRALRGRLP